MALDANRDVKFFASQELVELGVADAVRIHKGALVGLDAASGWARPLVAGDAFLGVAYAEADNTGAGHAAGAIRARLHQHVDIVHAVSGLAQTDIGGEVYASDDGTLTTSAGGNSRVGRIVAVEGVNLARVRCQPHAST